MNNPIELLLPWPPSVNTYYRAFRGRNILSKRGREYRVDALAAIGPVDTPLAGRLEVSLGLYPPDARRRDVDNYSKGVLDALTHAGVWVDDEQIDKLGVLKCPRDKENPRVVVTVTELRHDQD